MTKPETAKTKIHALPAADKPDPPPIWLPIRQGQQFKRVRDENQQNAAGTQCLDIGDPSPSHLQRKRHRGSDMNTHTAARSLCRRARRSTTKWQTPPRVSA
jgi:hypothetical protein